MLNKAPELTVRAEPGSAPEHRAAPCPNAARGRPRAPSTEFADDKQDAATALSEARRLVSQVGAFAIVGDVSANNPKDYFVQQKVPYFGGGWDATYCSPKPSTSVLRYLI